MLCGPSSAGKTALARELHQLLDEPVCLFVADECFPPMRPAPSVEQALEPAIVVFHRTIAQWAASGRNVIVDGALPYGDVPLRRRCLDELAGFRTYIVAVTCSVEELRRRESDRPDARLPGWAERQHRDINDGLPIAVHVDTSDLTPTDAARRVITALADLRV